MARKLMDGGGADGGGDQKRFMIALNSIGTTPRTPGEVEDLVALAEKALREAYEIGLRDAGVKSEPIEVTVVLAAEKFAPIQYHSFDVGPFMVKTTQQPGESIAQVYGRVMPELRKLQAEEFRERLPAHLAMVKTAGAAARGGR